MYAHETVSHANHELRTYAHRHAFTHVDIHTCIYHVHVQCIVYTIVDHGS